MNQTISHVANKELKFQKSTVVRLNVTKIGQVIKNQMVHGGTTGSTAPECDSTMATVTTLPTV